MGRRIRTSVVIIACGVAALGTPCSRLQAATATWTNADLDLWVYNNADHPGTRYEAPTWLNSLVVNPTTHQFELFNNLGDPIDATNPARLGTALFAFNAAAQITPGLTASRYQINSVTFKATCGEFATGQIPLYETAPVSQSQILTEYQTSSINWQKPMELYGVGFRAGYTGYEFTNVNSGPPLIDENTGPYVSGDGGYVVYPVVGTNTPGVYVDVSNSVTGGFSATAPGNSAAPFTPTPWAIGTTNLSVGDPIPNDTTFTFTLDLNAPGVRSYVQQSLASGAIGLFVSSLHATTYQGGSGVYPRWYTRDAAGGIVPVPPASLPQLMIDYTILPEGVPGDYNGIGMVDAADYVLWRNGGPLQNQVDDPTQVNAQDYVAWRQRFGNTAGSSATLGGGVVPEPAGPVMFLAGTVWVVASRRSPRNNR